MAVVVRSIIPPKLASVALTSEYLAAEKTIVDQFTVTNNGGGVIALDVHVVPSAGSPIVGNRVVNGRLVAAGETFILGEVIGQVIEAGSAIWCSVTAAGTVVLFASGRTVT